eukprot:3213790-Rhodomonas_salina.1
MVLPRRPGMRMWRLLLPILALRVDEQPCGCNKTSLCLSACALLRAQGFVTSGSFLVLSTASPGRSSAIELAWNQPPHMRQADNAADDTDAAFAARALLSSSSPALCFGWPGVPVGPGRRPGSDRVQVADRLWYARQPTSSA